MALNTLTRVPFTLAVASTAPSVVIAMHAISELCAAMSLVAACSLRRSSTRTCPRAVPGQASTPEPAWQERQQSPRGLSAVGIFQSGRARSPSS